jgi:molybdenum cofactor synthesis domain-containing protein
VTAIRVAVLTVSDKGARGERVDTSGPAIRALAREAGAAVVAEGLVADEPGEISDRLRGWCDGGAVDVVITTGGTGFSARDVTPEATMAVLERYAAGVAEALRAAGLQRTPFAALSRGVAGIRGQTLIVNLPGSEKAVRENMETLLPLLPHAVAMLREGGDHGASSS